MDIMSKLYTPHTLTLGRWFNPTKRSSFYFLYNYSHTSTILTPPSNLFTFNFIRKESFYTKLKYSRVPQFDTSSGAVASLLSGFYGFLVCEKFGFELIDSGDFLFLLVYVGALLAVISCLLKIGNGLFSLTTFVYSWFRSFF